MLKIRVLELLRERGKSNYWLYNQLGMSSENFKRLAQNQTTGISYRILEDICCILECGPGDLFVLSDDPPENESVEAQEHQDAENGKGQMKQ